MTNDGKENIRHVTCTNHTTRSDRDLFRVCPSKLSKRELEDLYFSLLENNKQLKKTVNGQRDQIKLLNTKVNRMTVQKNALGNLNKDCCSGVKAIINEQKESIADLKNANERLTDRIRLLNMRLCSAKQFLRRSPAQSRCTKCCLTPYPSVKNSSMSALNAKGSEANLRSQTEAGSCQFLNKENSTLKADENVEASLTEMKDEPCLQNKCRTVMDELKQKIENLEEELSKTHEQYSERMRRLEEQMRDLRVENTRVRARQAGSDHRLEAEEKRAGELLRKLRDAETQCDNLETELQIEKSKVCELETQVKAADLSSQLAAALEKHLKNNMTNRRASFVQSKTELRVPTLDLCASDWSYSPPMLVPNNSEISKYSGPEHENNVIKNSDDSGYAEKFDDKKCCPKTDQNILDQIASLQAQLNSLKLSMGSQNHNDPGDDTKSVTGDSLQKTNETDSVTNEMYAVMGARSSLSEDIFRPSRLKNQVDQCPSTSRAPDFLISMEDINRSPPKGSVKTLNKFDSHSQFQMPLPVDAPRMPYFGETGNNHQSLNRPRQSEKKISSDSTFDKHFNESRDVIEDVEKQNDDLRINDGNRNADHNAKEEILNGHVYDRKSRRSSLKFPHQDRSKDLSVSYGHNKIIVGSTIDIVDIDKDTQGDDNGKVIRAPCKYDSDPSVEFKVSERNLKKKIHYETQNLDFVPRNNSHFDATVSEKECGLNIDNDHKLEESFATPTIKDKIDNVNSEIQYSNDVGATKKGESPGTSSGKSTYTVEGKPSQGKMTKDATYQVDKEIKDPNIQVENGDNHLDICQGHARICTCPHIPHRDVSVFRTCSGTLRFKTTLSTKNKFRQCHCTRDSVTDMHGNGCPRFAGVKASVNGQSAKRSRMLHPMDASTPNHQKTYKVEGSAEVTRSTSPDNTDHEISSLTDLPNEDKSPRDYISPGEEKATSTFSDSYAAATTTDYGSLSLGEIPISGAKKLSDTQTRDKQTDSIAVSTTSYKMEEALNAISEELARCRELLQGQLPAQKTQVLIRDNSSMTEETPIELRRAEGKARIGGAATPKCIFTIHVGTVVLSDQAVMCSRGKSLALTWRFYNQTATMTRLLAGRVMPFDFSTEYDLKITDHFLNYLKLEEMPIIICEMEKQEEPFASCALPLRDALLHTNRRVDMSLALMAGPQMFLEQSMNNLETNEEVGVLDVWCLLRVEPSALAAINSTIINSQSPRATAYKSPRRSSLMEQMLDDDQSVEDRSSQELRVRTRTRTSQSPRATAYKSPRRSSLMEQMLDDDQSVEDRSSQELRVRTRTRTSKRPVAVIEAEVKKSSDSTSIYDILKSKKWIRKRSSVSKDSRPEGSRQKSVSYDPKLPLSQSSSILEHKDENVHIIATDDTLQSIDITVLWLALNEDCKAMTDPAVKRLYIAYSFLGRSGAELETPTSLPKPKHYMDKLHFMFKKTFTLNECDLPLLGHMARCRYPTAGSIASVSNSHDPKHCVVFTIISEPPEDPLGLDSCEDVGFAYLYLGDVLAYSAGAEQYTAIVGVHTAGQEEAVCGAIAVKIDGLSLLRRCVALSYSDRSFEFCEWN